MLCILTFSLCVFIIIVSVGSATVISPLELIRTKLQSQKQSYRELTDCIRSAVETEGWLSLWRGLGPTLLRDVPFSAMYWYNYENSKRWLCEWYNTREPTLTITFISGALSGSVSVTFLLWNCTAFRFSSYRWGYWFFCKQAWGQKYHKWLFIGI